MNLEENMLSFHDPIMAGLIEMTCLNANNIMDRGYAFHK